ncbi:hypothetical protein [Microcoleus sp. CAWBG58]|uniref:hypothetical protein n=1 Tax=Microcoleus sp. CAWBG58 TaxID=2841651 RepID=UPI0025D052E5|nr:hypothetical protein [Microcoleus sp. CAWBG58]
MRRIDNLQIKATISKRRTTQHSGAEYPINREFAIEYHLAVGCDAPKICKSNRQSRSDAPYYCVVRRHLKSASFINIFAATHPTN